jgi:hypothetical protein
LFEKIMAAVRDNAVPPTFSHQNFLMPRAKLILNENLPHEGCLHDDKVTVHEFGFNDLEGVFQRREGFEQLKTAISGGCGLNNSLPCFAIFNLCTCLPCTEQDRVDFAQWNLCISSPRTQLLGGHLGVFTNLAIECSASSSWKGLDRWASVLMSSMVLSYRVLNTIVVVVHV